MAGTDNAPSSDLKDRQHRIFYWMSTSLGEENDDVPPPKVVKSAGVPRKVLLEHISSELEEESSFLSLPFALLLVFVFAGSFVIHDQTSMVRDIEDAITFDIEENANFAFSDPGFIGHKAVYDVNSYADFHSWLRIGLRPLILSHSKPQAEDDKSEPKNKTAFERRFYLNYNRIIGGLLIKQVRAQPQDIPDSDLAHLYSGGKDSQKAKPIYPLHTANYPMDLHHKPEIYDVITIRPEYDDSSIRWLLLTDEPHELDHTLTQLWEENYIDERTIQAVVDFIVYNAHFNTLTYTSVNFLQSRSGHLWRSVTHETLFMQLYGSNAVASYIFDAIFVLQLAWIFITEVKELVGMARTHINVGNNAMDFLRNYLGVWNSVDWASIILGAVLVVMFTDCASATKGVRDMLLDVGRGDTKDKEKLMTLFTDFKDASQRFNQLRFLCVIYPIVIMLRLFKAFAAQPRLALVTRTLSTAAVDVAHFGIVFFAIFFSYAVMANALFGREMDSFSTIGRSTNTCFRVLMGDFDVGEMQQVGRVMTGIWFWSFMILVLLIMLNMLLAIIMDTYTNVKGQVTRSETLCEQAEELYRRWWQKRKKMRVSLPYIKQCWEKELGMSIHELLQSSDSTVGDQIVNVEDFVRVASGIKERQAERLLVSSVADFKSNLEAANPLSLSEAMGVISKIYQKLDHHIADWKKRFEAEKNTEERKVEERAAAVADKPLQAPAAAPAANPQETENPAFELKTEHVHLESALESAPPIPMDGNANIKAPLPQQSGPLSVSFLERVSATVGNAGPTPRKLAQEHSLGVLLAAAQMALHRQQGQFLDEPSVEVLRSFLRTSAEAWAHLGVESNTANGNQGQH